MLKVSLTKTNANGQYVVPVCAPTLLPLVGFAVSLLVEDVLAGHGSCGAFEESNSYGHNT